MIEFFKKPKSQRNSQNANSPSNLSDLMNNHSSYRDIMNVGQRQRQRRDTNYQHEGQRGSTLADAIKYFKRFYENTYGDVESCLEAMGDFDARIQFSCRKTAQQKQLIEAKAANLVFSPDVQAYNELVHAIGDKHFLIRPALLLAIRLFKLNGHILNQKSFKNNNLCSKKNLRHLIQNAYHDLFCFLEGELASQNNNIDDIVLAVMQYSTSFESVRDNHALLVKYLESFSVNQTNCLQAVNCINNPERFIKCSNNKQGRAFQYLHVSNQKQNVTCNRISDDGITNAMVEELDDQFTIN